MSYTGLAIQYLVVPRRNFSSPPSSHPRPPPLPPNPYSSAPPNPICLETFITLQESCVSNLQEEAVRGGRGTRGGEGVVERRRGLNIRKSEPPPYTRPLELHFIICEKCSTEKHFKMPHTKCFQSSKFIPLVSLISPKVKTVSHFLADKEVYHSSLYTLSLYFLLSSPFKRYPH